MNWRETVVRNLPGSFEDFEDLFPNNKKIEEGEKKPGNPDLVRDTYNNNVLKGLFSNLSSFTPIFSKSSKPQPTTGNPLPFVVFEGKGESAGADHQYSQNPQNLPEAKKCAADSEELRALRLRGTRPATFTKAVRCKVCGPVFEEEWVDDHPEVCRWCFRKPGIEIPRPTHAPAPRADRRGFEDFEAFWGKTDGGLVAFTMPNDEAEARATLAYPCTCGGRRFWVSVHGPVICGRCHPPAKPELVRRWLDMKDKQ